MVTRPRATLRREGSESGSPTPDHSRSRPTSAARDRASLRARGSQQVQAAQLAEGLAKGTRADRGQTFASVTEEPQGQGVVLPYDAVRLHPHRRRIALLEGSDDLVLPEPRAKDRNREKDVQKPEHDAPGRARRVGQRILGAPWMM